MTTITFDTHEFVKQLREAGFTEPQAEVITALQRKASDATLEQTRQEFKPEELATRHDLDMRIKEVELRIAETRADLIRWVVGAGVLQTAIIIALLLRVANHL